MNWKNPCALALALLLVVALKGECDFPKPSDGYLVLMDMLKEDSTRLDSADVAADVWISVMNSDSTDSLGDEIFNFRWEKFHDAKVHPDHRIGFLAGLYFNRNENGVEDDMVESVANDTFSVTAGVVLAQWGEWESCVDTLVAKGVFWPLIAYEYKDAAEALEEAVDGHDDPGYRMSAARYHDLADTVETISATIAEEILETYVGKQGSWDDTLSLSAGVQMAYEAIGSDNQVVTDFLEAGTNDERWFMRLWSMAKLRSMALGDSSEAAINLLSELAENSQYEYIREEALHYYWMATGQIYSFQTLDLDNTWTYHVDATLSAIQNRSIYDDYHYSQAQDTCCSLTMHWPLRFSVYPFVGKAMHWAGAGWCDFWRWPDDDETIDASLSDYFSLACTPYLWVRGPDQHQTICYGPPPNSEFLTSPGGPFAIGAEGYEGSERWAVANPGDTLRRGWMILWNHDYHSSGGYLQYTCAAMFVVQDQAPGQPQDAVQVAGICHFFYYPNPHTDTLTTLGALAAGSLGGLPRVILKPVGCGAVPQIPGGVMRQRKEEGR